MKEQIPKEVLQRLAARKGQTWTAAFFYLMKELHLSAEEIVEMPLSRINVLLLELRDHNKREEEEHKKASRKR